MDEILKAVIIEVNGEYIYYDKEGNELHEGDTIRYTNGTTEKLYLTNDNMLGIDATNRKWIESGRAMPCEYGIYPLGRLDMQEIVKIDAESAAVKTQQPEATSTATVKHCFIVKGHFYDRESDKPIKITIENLYATGESEAKRLTREYFGQFSITSVREALL